MKSLEKEKMSLPEKFDPGWNVVIYNSDNISSDDVVDALKNSEVFYNEECYQIIKGINSQGYYVLSLFYKKRNAKKIIKKLREKAVHCELVYSRINDDNVFKLKTFLLQEIALNNSFLREMCYSLSDKEGGEE